MKKVIVIANTIATLFFFAAGVGILGYALYQLPLLTELKASTLFAYSIVMFLLAFRSNLSGFSAFGLKADLREKISEADAVINDLRNLAKLVLDPTLTTVASLGRWGAGFSHKEKHDIKIRAEEVMRSLHIPDKEIEEVLLELHKYNIHDLMEMAKGPVKELLKKRAQDKRREHEARYKGPITQNDEYMRSVNEMREYAEHENHFNKQVRGYDLIFNSYQAFIYEIKGCPILTKEEKKQFCADTPALIDLKYYCEHRDFREPNALQAAIEE